MERPCLYGDFIPAYFGSRLKELKRQSRQTVAALAAIGVEDRGALRILYRLRVKMPRHTEASAREAGPDVSLCKSMIATGPVLGLSETATSSRKHKQQAFWKIAMSTAKTSKRRVRRSVFTFL